jgi:TfoX/Sxy family transcriptional regulator of competence genes
MAYDTHLEERVSAILQEQKVSFQAKKMMGGLSYMVDDKMCIGLMETDLMVRIHPDKYTELLKRKGAKIMNFTGKEMKGYLFVSPEGFDFEEDLKFWIDECLAFNPLAKSSKKK